MMNTSNSPLRTPAPTLVGKVVAKSCSSGGDIAYMAQVQADTGEDSIKWLPVSCDLDKEAAEMVADMLNKWAGK